LEPGSEDVRFEKWRASFGPATKASHLAKNEVFRAMEGWEDLQRAPEVPEVQTDPFYRHLRSG
jgi:hypothetical protein